MRETPRPQDSRDNASDAVPFFQHIQETDQIETALELQRTVRPVTRYVRTLPALALLLGIQSAIAQEKEKPVQLESEFSPEVARIVRENFGVPLKDLLRDWRVTVPVEPMSAGSIIWHYKQTHASPTSSVGTMVGATDIDKSRANIRKYLQMQLSHKKPTCVFREGMMDNDTDRDRVKEWKQHVAHVHVLHQRILSTPVETLDDMDKLIERFRFIAQISSAFPLDSLIPVAAEVKKIVEEKMQKFNNLEERSDDSPENKVTKTLLRFKMVGITLTDAMAGMTGALKGGQVRHIGGTLSLYLEKGGFELCGPEDPELHARTKAALTDLNQARDRSRERWITLVDRTRNGPAYSAVFREFDEIWQMKSSERTEAQTKRIEEIREIVAPAIKAAEAADEEYQELKTQEAEKQGAFDDLALNKRNAAAMEKIVRVSEPYWEFGTGPISIALEWGASHDLTPDVEGWNSIAGNKIKFGYVTMEPR
ncbi:hypothetical protein HY417_04285 [Candidatus Kaiserbacteria bacterium]|nr:hypothetical protein [Candidatus Kaiserbacteria bacterium]